MILKKQLIILTIFSVSILFISSCCKIEENPIAVKFQYKEGDTIIFKSNLNNFDTLIVEEVKVWKTIVHLGGTCDESHEEMTVIYKKKNELNTFIGLTYFKDNDNHCGSCIIVDTSLIINGKSFENVEYGVDTTNDLSKLKERYFVHKYGIIKYTYRSNETFEINRLITPIHKQKQ